MGHQAIQLKEALHQRKSYIIIDDQQFYKRCRIQVRRKGIILRDFVKGSSITTKKQQICKHGDFIVAEIDAKVGGYGFLPEDLDGAIVSSHYFIFELNEKLILREYFEWLIKTDVLQKQINSKGSTNYAAVRPIDILSLRIELPSVSKQKELVKKLTNFIGNYEALIESISQQEDIINQLKQALLSDALKGKLTNGINVTENAEALLKRIKFDKSELAKLKKEKKKGDFLPIDHTSIPFDLPESWIWCRLEDLINALLSGYAFKSQLFQKTGSNQVLRLGNVKNGMLSKKSNPVYIDDQVAQSVEAFRVSVNDILITMTGTRLKRDYCFTTLIREDDLRENVLFVNQRVGCLKLNPLMNAEFVDIMLKSDILLDQLFEGETGTANQGNIGVNNIKNLLFPLPPIEHQVFLVKKIKESFQQLDQISSLAQTQEQLASLTTEALLSESFCFPDASSSNSVITEDDSITNVKVLYLASEIIWQLHRNQTLGHVKLQKLIFLCERTIKMELPINFLKQAMGPYDPKLQRFLDIQLEKKGWFKYDESKALKYQPLEYAGEHKLAYKSQFGEQSESIYHLIQLFENTNSARIEIVATLFACWDEMILNNQLVNDISLLNKFYNWSEFKGKYSAEQVKSALRWMESNGIVPQHSTIQN